MTKILKAKRWSRPASIAFSLLFIAIMCFTLLPSPVQIGPLSFGGAGVAKASGEYWLYSNGTAYGVGTTFENRRAIDITAASPQSYGIQQVVFIGNDTWTVPTGVITVKVLVVGGGGGGGLGDTSAGGGGAGGVVYDSAFVVVPGENITVTIGQGGAHSAADADKGVNGNSSSFGTLTAAAGGGGGGSLDNKNGADGASGGGASYNASSGTAGAENQNPDQGKAGGTAASNGGGGGGGAGVAGTNGATNVGGAGGNGIDAITDYGFTGTFGDSTYNGWVAGGGPGYGTTVGLAGKGGGGYYAAPLWHVDGYANTGGGGAGGWAGIYHGGSGGSGIVIIRYTASTPSVPANYKVPINVHRGSETVETGTWTVNGNKTYHNRVAFIVHIHEALAAAYPIKIVVDTASLVTGGFFGGSTSGYAKTPEWTSSSVVTDTMKFWVPEAGTATPTNFNTSVPGTTYYVKLPVGLAANTDHTMYMYVDPAISAASSNYSAADTFSFFEHFDTPSGNLTAFLGNYTMWEQSPATLATQQVIFNASDPHWEVPLYVKTVKVLVVAGGGGGGRVTNFGGGGGGAGGILYIASHDVTGYGGNVTVTVGQGGIAGSTGNGGDGANSVFGTLTALKGGGGGGYNTAGVGGNGTYGSGGGAGRDSNGKAGGVGTTGQGYAGGTTPGSSQSSGGGGGGAGAVGYNGVSDAGVCSGTMSQGGIGIDYSGNFTGTFGDSAYNGWVGGGGGGDWGGSSGVANGGKGGGGLGGANNYANAGAGQANTGGGGGGGGYSYQAAAGGSGVVIIQYGIDVPVVSVASSVLTLSNTAGRSWSGIATKTSGAGNFTIQNFQILMRVNSLGTGAASGMFSNAGLGTAPQSGIVLMGGESVKKYVNGSNSSSTYDYAGYPLELFTKYGTTYQITLNMDDPNGKPDRGIGDYAADDVSHKVVVASYGTGNITIDWIAVMPEIEKAPYVKFPDILYEKAGTVFLDNECLHWPFDHAYTASDGNTTFYRWPDPLTELTRQPGDSIQDTVEVTGDLSSNITIYIYYRHDGVTSVMPDVNATATYDSFYDFTSIADWTDDAGYSIDTGVIEPTLYRGDVGNVGGGAGRLWARFNQVVKWGDGTFYMIFDNVLWEKLVLWPTPYRIYIAHSDTIEGKFEPGHLAFTDGSLEHHAWGYWPYSAQVIGNECYVLFGDGIGFKVAYCNIYTDPTVISNWTINPNGPFLTPDWINPLAGISSAVSSVGSLVKIGSTWRVFLDSLTGAVGYGSYEVHTEVSPENWTSNSDFTLGIQIIAGTYVEDSQIVYDGERYWYDFAVVSPFTLDDTNKYWVLDEDHYPFPGEHTADWGDAISQIITYPLYALEQRSPRLIKEADNWYQFMSGLGVLENTTTWAPNWVTVYECNTLYGNWTPVHTDEKYKQATTTGYQKAYVTASSAQDGEIIVECQLGSAVTNINVGITFRYDSVTDSGYYAYLNSWGNVSGSSIFLSKFSGATYNKLNGLYGYIIPTTPIPGFYQGYPWRLRVQFYGATIKVSYSPWGNEWVEIGTVTDNTYLRAGKVGVETSTAEGYFNNFRVRGFVLNEPVVGQAESEEYSVSISNTPSLWSVGVVQPSQSIYSKTGLTPPGFPLAIGNCTGNVTNLSSFTLDYLTVVITDFSGGTAINIVSTAPGANEARVMIFESGAGNDTDGIYLTNAAQNWVASVAADEEVYWELKLETGNRNTFAYGVYTATLTFTTDPVGDTEDVAVYFTWGDRRRGIGIAPAFFY